MPGRAQKRYTCCVTINKLFLVVISSSLLWCSRCRDTRSLHLRAQIWNLETGRLQVFCIPSFPFIQQSPSLMALRVHCKMPCVQPEDMINVGEMAWRVEDKGIKARDHSHLIITCLGSMETVTALTHKSQKVLTIIKQHFFLLLFLWTNIQFLLSCSVFNKMDGITLFWKILSSLIYNFKAVSWPNFLACSQQSEYHTLWNHLQSTPPPNQNILKPNSVGCQEGESSPGLQG